MGGVVGKGLQVASGFIPDPATSSIMNDTGTAIEVTAELIEANKKKKAAEKQLADALARERADIAREKERKEVAFAARLKGNRQMSRGGKRAMSTGGARAMSSGGARVAPTIKGTHSAF